MIRDPSDGSIKEITPDLNDINEVNAEKPSKEITYGLPGGSKKPKDLARLEASREWLKNYLHRK